MRETLYVALVVGLMVAATAHAATGSDRVAPGEHATTHADVSGDPTSTKQARERLTDVLTSNDIDRIDFQATTYEEGIALINTTIEEILDIGVPVLGDAKVVADKAVEVVLALNASKMRGTYATFQEDKQTLFVRSQADASGLGEIVGTSISIIHGHFGSTELSYKNRAANLFRRVQIEPEDTRTLLETYLETVEFVAQLPSHERAKYLN
jgi:hypothetical protein